MEHALLMQPMITDPQYAAVPFIVYVDSIADELKGAAGPCPTEIWLHPEPPSTDAGSDTLCFICFLLNSSQAHFHFVDIRCWAVDRYVFPDQRFGAIPN